MFSAKKHIRIIRYTRTIMSEASMVDIPKEVANMWQSYQRLCSVCHTLKNPKGEINDSILDVIAGDPGVDPLAIAMWGNYLKLMLASQKDGFVFPLTEQHFSEWYKDIPKACPGMLPPAK